MKKEEVVSGLDTTDKEHLDVYRLKKVTLSN